MMVCRPPCARQAAAVVFQAAATTALLARGAESKGSRGSSARRPNQEVAWTDCFNTVE